MHVRSSALNWIVPFKAFKAVTLTTLGIALLATRHDDPVDLLTRLALTAHLTLSSELFERALRFAVRLSVGKQIALAVTAFGYAVLMGSEGVAPSEVYEILRDLHALRVVVLVANMAIVVYLLKEKELFHAFLE